MRILKFKFTFNELERRKKMKKGIVALSALLALGLASCSDDRTPKDEVAPEISGNQDKVCTVDEEVNLLAGLSAIDDVDGDITENIQVTLIPSLDVTNGRVTPTETGDYEVQYKVSDQAGNVAEAFATLTVNPHLAEKTKYLEYSFNGLADNPFSTWAFEGLTVEESISKGNYKVSGTTDNEAWHVKFLGEVATTANADYEVIYEFNSDVEGNVTFEANDLPANKTVAITKGYNKLSFKFTAGEAKESQGYCLQLGALEAFNLEFSKIEVIETIGVDVWASVVDGLDYTQDGVVSSVFDNNSEGNVTTAQDSATMNITRGSDENGVWQTKLFVATGVDLEANVKYKVSLDLEAENAIDDFEICYNSGDVEKGVGALYGQKLEAGVKKSFEFVTTLDSAKDNLVIQFQLGKANEPQGANEVTVSNVKVERIVTEDEALVPDYTFANDNLDSHFWSESVGTFEASTDATKAILDVTTGTTTPNPWEIWAVIGVGKPMDANRDYTVSIDLLADNDVAAFEGVLRTFGLEDTKGGAYNITLTKDEVAHVSFDVHLDEKIETPAVVFQLGAIQEATKIEFSNLSVVAKGGSKEVHSEAYTFSPEGFGTFNDAASAEGFLYTEDGKLVYEMTKIGLVDWHNKLYIPKLHLEADKIYTIEFVAHADKEISCAFFLNPCGKWEPRVSEEVAFTTEETTFSYVTPSFAADMDFEVLFQFGSDVNQALGSAKIEFSSIIIYAQDVE